nr:MAG TPA: hypothetical protein [Caudoviricetes sp.]
MTDFLNHYFIINFLNKKTFLQLAERSNNK